MDEFSRRRWELKGNPNEHPARAAIEAALEAIERDGEPAHCVVIFATKREEGDGGQRWKFFNAGSFSLFETKGLVYQVAQRI